jgi:lipopolysaccharide transport system permease protein
MSSSDQQNANALAAEPVLSSDLNAPIDEEAYNIEGSFTVAPTVVIERRRGLFDLGLGSIWAYRELLYFLVWRDLKVRYKQTIIGVGWAVLQPLITMLILSVIFGHYAKIPSDGLPYPIFAYCALLPWNYFATALNRCTVSVVADGNLISKIYFPRLLLPLAGTISGLVDFSISFVLLTGFIIWYGIGIAWPVAILPLFLMFALVTALAVGVWLSALNVRYRDVSYAIPFLIQVWMFASPVVYPVNLIPEQWRFLYSLNPMAGVIEGFRWALLGKASPDFSVMGVSALVVVIILYSGLIFFRNMERTFADVV